MKNENIFRQPIETQNVRAVKNAVRTAVSNNTMMAVIAELGSGKTTLYNYLADYWNQHPHRFRVVTIKGFDDRISRISSIMKLLIESINPDAHIPKQIERVFQTLTRELRVFCKNANNRVILMVDEAQDMNLQTFRDIKKIHEIDGHGRDHLLSVVLFGKPHRKWDKLFSTPELGYRMEAVLLEKLNAEELSRIAEERFNIKFENNKVRERFTAALKFKTPLGVEFFSRALRKELGIEDDETALVTADLATRIPMLSLKIRAKQAGITQAEIAKVANQTIPNRKVGIQRVNELFSGKLDDDKLADELTLVTEDMINRRFAAKRRRISGEE